MPPKSESELIRQLRQEFAASAPPDRRASVGAPQDFVDDMALVEPGGATLLWTVDTLMDGVDFESARHCWSAIGGKAMGVNLSDCAAMAARPISALCAVALSNALSLDDAMALMRGAHETGLRFGCPIVGGDTNSWDAPTAISITIAARPEPGLQAVRRDGARLGDRIFLTGPVGGSLLGRHMTPNPRIDTALAINRSLAPAAMIDVSDGLACDLGHILDASGCGATLDAAALEVAIHPDAQLLAARDGVSPRDHALYDGEDFELIVVLPPRVDDAQCAALGLIEIGRIDVPDGLFISAAGGRTLLDRRGWEHFR